MQAASADRGLQTYLALIEEALRRMGLFHE